MTLRDAILKSLAEINHKTNAKEIYNYIEEHQLYEFGLAKTPVATIGSMLGEFVRKGDENVRRLKGESGFLYYISDGSDEPQTGKIFNWEDMKDIF